MRPALLFVLMTALSAHASVYYVTVAGLGGEPDYEQRFTANAKDLDKLFKESGSSAHVYTLTGTQATRAQLTQTLGSIAHDARPEDDFVLMLIGHGSFDGTEYKFNLVGPDISGAELGALCDKIPSKRQLIVNTTSASGGSIAALEKPGRAVIAATPGAAVDCFTWNALSSARHRSRRGTSTRPRRRHPPRRHVIWAETSASDTRRPTASGGRTTAVGSHPLM